MEQLVFKFVTDEERRRLEMSLRLAEENLVFVMDRRNGFSHADMQHRRIVVDRLKKKLAELP